MRILNTVPQTVKIKRVIEENDLVKTFVLDHSVDAQPGQFVNVWIPRLDEKPFSVAMDNGKEMYLAIAAVGPFSKAMHELSEGDRVGVRGPFGQPFTCEDGQHLAFLAGGYGAAPLYFFAHEAVKKGCKIEFIVGARSKALLLYGDRIQKLDGVNHHVSTDDGTDGHHGYNTQVLEKILKENKIDCVYTCGPEIMMLKGGELAEKYATDAQISVERYMGCGFGVCGKCVVDGLGVPSCMSGPVMHLKDVKKIEDFGRYHRDALGKKHYL